MRRAASTVTRTVIVAPVTGRTPFFSESSSLSILPGNCPYHVPRGWYSWGSEKERTSIREIAPLASTATRIVSGSVRTTCVSKYAVPAPFPSTVAT